MVICISPLTKFLIEKFDKTLTGREISTGWVYVNPLTGYAYVHDLVILEAESDSVFLSAKGLGVDISLSKLIFLTYEFSEITLTDPLAFVIQSGSHFNFSDVIEKFTPDSQEAPSDDPVKFRLNNLNVVNGEFHYKDTKAAINYFVKHVHLSSPGFGYDADTLPIRFDLESGIGTGKIGGDCSINIGNLDYRTALQIDNFNLDIINQYLRELTNYGVFAATLDADLQSSGNFGDIRAFSTAGQLKIRDFHFGKNVRDDYASFTSLDISIIEVTPEALIYRYDSVSLVEPFFRYERYDELDNIQTMFGKNGAKVSKVNASNQFNLVLEMAKAIEQLSRNFFRSDYEIGRVAIYKGNFEFSDYSLSEQFTIGLHPFFAHADSMNKSRDRIQVFVESAIRPYGDLWVSLTVDPKDSGYFDLDYQLQKISLAMFNPYVYTYTSFPINRGFLEIHGEWNVKRSIINSSNHLIMSDLRMAAKVKSEDAQWAPMPLALAFVRENGNFIDYEIPIKGTLNDPTFKIKDVLLDLLENVFVKPMTTPYRMQVKNIEQELETSLSMQWPSNKYSISSMQEEFIEKLVDFMKDEPKARISIQPMIYETLEKEFILMFEAKKRFLFSTGQMAESTFSNNDSLHTARMSIKDSAFVRYLDKECNDPTLFTAQHKAAKLIPVAEINDLYDRLEQKRQSEFLKLFVEANVSDRVTFIKPRNTVPFNGFSFFSIGYSGDFPPYLREAITKMITLDTKNPREHSPSKETIPAS